MSMRVHCRRSIHYLISHLPKPSEEPAFQGKRIPMALELMGFFNTPNLSGIVAVAVRIRGTLARAAAAVLTQVCRFIIVPLQLH